MTPSAVVATLAKGGPVMVPLVACSVVSVAVILERAAFWWRARGAETVERALQLAASGKWDDAIECVRGSSVVRARNKIGLVPEHQVSFWNKIDLPYGFAVALGVIHQSTSFTSFNNTVKLPGFTRVDAAAYYTFLDGKMRLALNVENLGGTKYYPTADGDNNISPGAPINARLTLSAAF